MLARRATRRAMIDENGVAKLPTAARRGDSVTMFLIIAAASGALLALGDVLRAQRKELAESS